MDEYERDKAFLGYMVRDLVAGLPTEAHPLAVLAQDELRRPSRARQGLRMAVNDMVEMSSAWSPAQARQADDALRAIGASTLTEVRARYSKGLARVERRGAIRTEVEAHLVKGMLDGDVDALSEERRERLRLIFSAYENSLG